MLKKLKIFLAHLSGVIIIEFAMIIPVILLFTAASVDVYTTYNIKSKAQDVLQNVALGVSKSDLNQNTLDAAVARAQDMMAPYNVANGDFQIDIHTQTYESGTDAGGNIITPAITDITATEGGLGIGAMAPCDPVLDLGLPPTTEDGYADVITARLCINPEQIEPTIFGTLLNGVFDKNQDLCQRICTLGQNTIKNNEDLELVSGELNSFGSEGLDSSRSSDADGDVYETTLACRMVITDIANYGPCTTASDPLCGTSPFYYPGDFGSVTNINPAGAGSCQDQGGSSVSSVIYIPPTTPIQTNVTVELFNGCNADINEADIDTDHFSAPDDTRSTTSFTLQRYDTVTDGFGVQSCVFAGNETWEPEGTCGAWNIVSGRSDLRDNGVFYTQEACPHPRSRNTDYGAQDGCTRVLVPKNVLESTFTGSSTCDMSTEFSLHDNAGVDGMTEWNRMRREIYHLRGFQHGFGTEHFYDNFRGDVYYNSTRPLEGVWINRDGTDNVGPRPPDGPHSEGGTNTGGGGTNTLDHNRYMGNPLYSTYPIDLSDCTSC